ncbi:MAG: beta-propeller fold lactonase family protein [Gemmatimonadaceae bacterium]
MRTQFLIAASALALAACADSSSLPTAPVATSSVELDRGGERSAGAVFTATNATSGNSVVAFARAKDGSLAPAGSFPTGGSGIGGTTDPLGSQYSIALDDDDDLLFIVNAGSNDISTFRVNGAQLTLLSTTSSAGTLPVSLSVSRGILYVLNASTNNVAGFNIGENGTLTPNARASASLSSGAAAPAAVRASRDGRFLVVTEKGSKTIDTYRIGHSGSLSAPVSSPSSGDTPFGFDFALNGQVAVSEAGSAAASLYDVGKKGKLTVESAWFRPTVRRRHAG